MQNFVNLEDEIFLLCLPKLLKNNSTEKNLLSKDKIKDLKPRSQKSQNEQLQRTRQNAEVFTPAWLCGKMIDYFDEEFKNLTQQDYIKLRCIEIACGEAPFIISRYDAVTGQEIKIEERTGILDRKLKKINELNLLRDEWLKYSLQAFQSVYGYELQADSLLIARINLFMTFIEYYKFKWPDAPQDDLFKIFAPQIADVIAWNFWQMDGLNVPEESGQLTLFENQDSKTPCKIKDWQKNIEGDFINMSEKKFDFCISNPPYQDETVGKQKNFASPVYNFFMDSAFEIADKVELITPARFLFNAGATPKEWNEKMLNDPHFKVLKYEADSSKIFTEADIKGGVAVTYRDENKNFGAIGTFTAYPELNSILEKVKNYHDFQNFSTIISNRGLYRFSKQAYDEHPEEMAKISDSRIGSSAFERMPSMFFDEKPEDGKEYAKFLGLVKMKRVYKWLRSDYFNKPDNFEAYKVFLPKANGSGALGEVLSTPVIGLPVIGLPVIGSTETFISIGCFGNETEAEACCRYVKTKFARTMLGILKVTQDNTAEKWRYVPLQNFTPDSDIDWSKSIHEIDEQLYAKYKLSDNEIKFIEEHVKEMA